MARNTKKYPKSLKEFLPAGDLYITGSAYAPDGTHIRSIIAPAFFTTGNGSSELYGAVMINGTTHAYYSMHEKKFSSNPMECHGSHEITNELIQQIANLYPMIPNGILYSTD